jgi:REP element-mobilizing transposase RayT
MPPTPWPAHADPNYLHFITASALQRAPLFRRDVIKRILVDSLNTGRILGQYDLFAFVIMPNHVHLIVRCLAGNKPADVVREFKKATANLMLRHYEAEENQRVLEFCASGVKREEKQRYAIWNDEYQAKDVFSPAFLRQKIDYIHNNPVQSHWQLVDEPQRYLWSSARFYLSGGRALIPLTDAGDLLM